MEARFDVSNYELDRPLPKRKIKNNLKISRKKEIKGHKVSFSNND